MNSSASKITGSESVSDKAATGGRARANQYPVVRILHRDHRSRPGTNAEGLSGGQIVRRQPCPADPAAADGHAVGDSPARCGVVGVGGDEDPRVLKLGPTRVALVATRYALLHVYDVVQEILVGEAVTGRRPIDDVLAGDGVFEKGFHPAPDAVSGHLRRN